MFVLLMFFQSETELELGSLLRQDFQGLHNELLLRLGEHYQQVHTLRISLCCAHISNDLSYVVQFLLT